MHHGVIKGAMLALLLISAPTAADAQPAADRADPSIAGARSGDEALPQVPRAPLRIAPHRPAEADQAGAETVLVGAVRVDGAVALPPAVFAPAIEPFLGRPLSPTDLRGLATEV